MIDWNDAEKLILSEKFAGNVLAEDEEGRRVTYSDLAESVEKFSEICPERELAFILCRNTFGSLLSYLDCMLCNVVPLLLPADVNKERLSELIDEYRPGLIFAPEDIRIAAEEIGRIYDFNIYKNAFETSLNPQLALLLNTSGSTGSPKLVRLSRKNIWSNAASIADYLKIDKNERPITSLPMNYTYGLSVINSHVICGATILLTQRSVLEKEFWDFLRRSGATSFAGVPFTYKMLKRIGMTEMDIGCLKTLTQAGGKLPVELHLEYAKWTADKGIDFVVMYGQTEATARMGYLPPEKSLSKVGSMGIAIPGGKFWLRDDDGKEIQSSHISGELVYEGPNVSLGYAGQRGDLLKEDENQGVLFTGDMAEFDEDGFFTITGRKKRFIKIYGNRVSLDEMESLLHKKFPMAEFACCGCDDRLKVFTDWDEKDGEEQIIDYYIELTGFAAKSVSVKIINKLPVSESGKILYSQLEKM